MGGALKTTRKVIDPLNIMDPAGILPGPKGGKFGTPSWQSSDKKKKKSGGYGGGGSSVDPNTEMMMKYMNKMEKQQSEQAEAARAAQQAAFIESQKQYAASAAQQGELGASQLLAQAGAMQKARDISALEAQKGAISSAGSAAIGGGFDIAKARGEQAANLAGAGNIPSTASLPYYGMDYSTPETSPKIRTANTFNLPRTQGITFGGQ
jgi:hypothetical protein